jgi:hypothetical protein
MGAQNWRAYHTPTVWTRYSKAKVRDEGILLKMLHNGAEVVNLLRGLHVQGKRLMRDGKRVMRGGITYSWRNHTWWRRVVRDDGRVGIVWRRTRRCSRGKFGCRLRRTGRPQSRPNILRMNSLFKKPWCFFNFIDGVSTSTISHVDQTSHKKSPLFSFSFLFSEHGVLI